MDGMPADVQRGRMVDEATIAHEFGLAIQARTASADLDRCLHHMGGLGLRDHQVRRQMPADVVS